jgi:hypothetical protein
MKHKKYSLYSKIVLCLVGLSIIVPQPAFSGRPQGNNAKVEKAINKGIEALLENLKPLPTPIDVIRPPNIRDSFDTSELVLYTLISTGANRTSQQFQSLLDHVLTKRLERTYNVALTAMALQTLDDIRYQDKIAECAQFLVDNQCSNGQWSYGAAVPPRDSTEVSIPPSQAATTNTSQTFKMIHITKRTSGPAHGDNSNTQYACLGLRACMQAKIIIPNDIFLLTKQWLENTQSSDGGWAYETKNQSSYGSMTAGALSSLIMCEFYLNKLKSTKGLINNPRIQKGLGWIVNHFSVEQNPRINPAGSWHYYWLYVVERLGAFLETDSFGPCEWYSQGAEYLLAHQDPSGSWLGNPTDTCFAILFLKRATPPLVKIITK